MATSIVLAGIVSPEPGLLIWMSVTFVIVFLLMAKFAWKPILTAIKAREESIENALKSAENAKAEMQELKSSNERILQEARNERDGMLKDAREIKEKMISEAKGAAKTEADKIMNAARETIHNEKMAAITELKNQVAQLSVEVAEKILKRELAPENKQKELIGDLLKETKLN
jgi:F-type H+-transporting ATPase subunit b